MFHYSYDPIVEFGPQVPKPRRDKKPSALWFAERTSWKDVASEWSEERAFAHRYEVVIGEDCRLLHVKDEADAIAFGETYGTPNPDGDILRIDWERVGKSYDGITIGFLYGQLLRRDSRLAWMHAWDVIGGCVWSTTGVELVDCRTSETVAKLAAYDNGADTEWMVCRPKSGDVIVKWIDLTPSERDEAIANHNKLYGIIIEHAKTIAPAERYSNQLPQGLSPISLSDFTCRRLVCATNAQLVAEKHLIRTFWPVWNQETKACWGMSKHGDSAGTRKNKRSPWDVVHPGRHWALDEELEDKLTPEVIAERIEETLKKSPPRKDHAALLEEMLAGFRQDAEIKEQEVPPVGDEASGPDPEEAGGEDDE